MSAFFHACAERTEQGSNLHKIAKRGEARACGAGFEPCNFHQKRRHSQEWVPFFMPAQRERNRARTCIKSRSGAKPVPVARASSPVTSTKSEGIHKSECLFSCLHEKAKQGTGRKRGRLRGNPEGCSDLPGAHVAVSKEEKGSVPSPLLESPHPSCPGLRFFPEKSYPAIQRVRIYGKTDWRFGGKLRAGTRASLYRRMMLWGTGCRWKLCL